MPETISITTSMNKMVLRHKLTEVRRLIVVKKMLHRISNPTTMLLRDVL